MMAFLAVEVRSLTEDDGDEVLLLDELLQRFGVDLLDAVGQVEGLGAGQKVHDGLAVAQVALEASSDVLAGLEEGEARKVEDAVLFGHLFVVHLDDLEAELVQFGVFGLQQVEDSVACLAIFAI